MPIYDYNGTTNYQIGKLYDNNGTTSYQIGKVYDNNGTTSSLIYSAGEYILQNGVAGTLGGGFTLTKQQYESQWTLNYNSEGCAFYCNSNGGSQSRVDTKSTIDWSQYSKLYVDLLGRDNDVYNTLYVTVAKGSPSTWILLPNSDTNVTQKQTGIAFSSITTRKTVEIDVSSITTAGSLMLGIRGISPWVKIYNIWVE